MASQIPPPPSQDSDAISQPYVHSYIYTDTDGDQYTVSVTYPDGNGNPLCNVKSIANRDTATKHGLRDSQ